MLSWHYVTKAQYDSAEPDQKTSDKLFFLSDTKEIYRGTELFTQACELYTTTPPATPAVGRLYIDDATLEGKIYNGSSWTTVIQPVQATLDDADTSKPVSGKAVADYVAQELTDVSADANNALNGASYAKATNTLTFTRTSGENPVTVEIDNLPVDLLYTAATGLLQLKDADGAAIGTGINLDLERFVSAAAYDNSNKKIYLAFNDVSKISVGEYTNPGTMPESPSEGDACRTTDGNWYSYNGASWEAIAEDETPLEIDVSALVDTYTGDATSTATTNVSGNQVTVDVKVSSTGGNLLTTDGNGLYVAPIDQSGKMDKDTDAVEGNVAKFDASGNAVDSGVKIGGGTLDGSPAATTLATEAAVEAIRNALQTAIDGKIAKISGGTAGNIVTVAAGGEVADSGKTIGGATLAETTNANTLATEAAVKAVADGKMDKDADATADNLAKFDSNGNAVDAGIVAGGATLAADPAATTLATEAAVEACLTWQTSV